MGYSTVHTMFKQFGALHMHKQKEKYPLGPANRLTKKIGRYDLIFRWQSFLGKHDKYKKNMRRWLNAGSPSTTLIQQ